MTDLTPGEAAYSVYRKRFCAPGHGTPWEDLGEGSRGFWTEIAAAAVERISGELTAQFQQVLATNRTAERARVAERIAGEIEAAACAPGDDCKDRFCPDCIAWARAKTDAMLARRIGGVTA